MQLNEFHTFNIKDAVKFHNKLNPKIFNPDNKMDKDVRDQLLLIAKDFITELGIKDLDVKDITVSGSNAAYSYTNHSDLDLHILVDFSKLPNNEVYQELFTAKKTVYNDEHDITVRGIPVELYVQDSNQPHISLGEYSVLHNKWLRVPVKDRENFNSVTTKAKYEKLLGVIKRAIKSKDLDKVKKTLDTLKRYRKAGLESAGEFGPENLAYKALRKRGYIQKLFDLRNKLHSEKLSIDENNVDEDWHPNDTPPGPEFKPTMPQGTVRVNVSDVYDWYKLGQNISNLDRVDKSKFGKGPPSTIMAFGSEEEEHKYIQALKTLGLDTTDIDPIDPKQPKNMPRQSVDPTYNVGVAESASGYIPSYAEKDDPRFKTALTVDIKPDSLKKNAKAFGFDISRAGIPPQAQPSGKYKRIKK